MPRRCETINRAWRFTRGDVAGAEAIGFDDSSWQRIGLPHTFDLPYFRTPEFYVGHGWYRRTIQVSVGETARAFLEFDGVFQVAELFVNGFRVGEHRGGYTGFSFNITHAIKPGENLIAIRVNNNWDPQLAPRAGEHIFSGGIYRDVRLVITNELYVKWCGTFVTTLIVSRESAVVNVNTEVRNDSASTKRCTLESHLLDRDLRRVAMMSETREVPPGETAKFDQTSNPIANPQLWHPDQPHQYVCRTQVLSGERIVDTRDTSFGIRWFEWTADRGLFLNGEHLYLRGANAHQDHAGWGIGITRAACDRDVRLIKEAGFNFARGSHYPHHPAFADACDRIGLIYLPENCFWGKGGFGPEGYWNASAYPVNEADARPFEDHCRQTLREMIRIERNHPSVIAWSMTNEAFFTYNLDRARNLISELVSLSREADPTRPVVIGGAQRGDVDHLGDIAAYNGDGARLFIHPGVPNLVSEYGAISKPHDAYDPFFGELQREQFPWRSGQAIWCAFDYGTIAGRQGLKGIVDHQRLPKRSWYWYRNEYRGIAPPEPPAASVPRRLRLSADKTTIFGTDATDDCQIIVTVLDDVGNHISNSPSVTLSIESGPGEFPTGRAITFDANTDIKIAQGHAATAFRSYEGGTTTIRATSEGLHDATITIVTEGSPAFDPAAMLACSRPYIPPRLSDAAVRAMTNVVNVALSRPCRASSEAENHPARLANDGDMSSAWLAGDADAAASWHVDLEGFYQLSGGRLAFPAEGNYRYLVEVSETGADWSVAIDRSTNVRMDTVRNEIYPPGGVARYVRIAFVRVPEGQVAGLLEFEVHGVLSVR